MKKLFLLASCLMIGHGLMCQVLFIHSKDSVDAKPRLEAGFGGWVKLSLVYDHMGIQTTAAMNPLFIPTGDAEPDPQFTGDMKQSRLKFLSIHRSKKLGEVKAYIEGDFYGAGTAGFRLRHAYIQGKRLLVGQYWSPFTDVDAWPNVADFDGPATGIWKRMPQIRYTHFFGSSTELALPLETSIPKYFARAIDSLVINEPNQNIPNLAAQFHRRLRSGHIALGGIFRNIRYEKQDSSMAYLQGFGVALTGTLNFGRNTFMYQAAGGKGIASYMSSFGGLGLDVLIIGDGSKGLIPTWGGFLSFQHRWGDSDFSSNVLFGWAIFNNNWFEDDQDAFYGTQSSVNLNWTPTENISVFLELQFGTHRDITGSYGDASRIMLTAEYSF